MSKIYIVAGNSYEAEVWADQSMKKRHAAGATTLSRSEYVYVRDAATLQGTTDPKGVFIGTWRERKDILDIVRGLMLRTSTENRTLHRIYRELRKGATLPLDEGDVLAAASMELARAIDSDIIKVNVTA